MVDGVRVSDAERGMVVERLAQALESGRLSAVEYEERVAAAYAATTRADLAQVKGDLPGHLW